MQSDNYKGLIIPIFLAVVAPIATIIVSDNIATILFQAIYPTRMVQYADLEAHNPELFRTLEAIELPEGVDRPNNPLRLLDGEIYDQLTLIRKIANAALMIGPEALTGGIIGTSLTAFAFGLESIHSSPFCLIPCACIAIGAVVGSKIWLNRVYQRS